MYSVLLNEAPKDHSGLYHTLVLSSTNTSLGILPPGLTASSLGKEVCTTQTLSEASWRYRGCSIGPACSTAHQRLHNRLVWGQRGDLCSKIHNLSFVLITGHYLLPCTVILGHERYLKSTNRSAQTQLTFSSASFLKCRIRTGQNRGSNISSFIHLTNCKRIVKSKIKVWSDPGKQFKCKYRQPGASAMKFKTWTPN